MRNRLARGLMACLVGYALLIQAFAIGVGWGMSANGAASPLAGEFVLCSEAHDTAPAPAGSGRQNTPKGGPDCPYCLAAANSAAHPAAMPAAPGLRIPYPVAYVAPYRLRAEAARVPVSRRTVAQPRAPPAFFV